MFDDLLAVNFSLVLLWFTSRRVTLVAGVSPLTLAPVSAAPGDNSHRIDQITHFPSWKPGARGRDLHSGGATLLPAVLHEPLRSRLCQVRPAHHPGH